MLGRLLPKKDIFFRLLNQQADKAGEAIVALRALFEDLPNVEAHLERVKAIEHAADELASTAIGQLHRTFITPLDRHDISDMTRLLDDIVDYIEGAAQRMFHYELDAYPEAARGLVDVLDNQITVLKTMVSKLSDLSKTDDILDAIAQIIVYEKEADHILRPAVGDLFRHEKDPMQVIKWKEIFEHLEIATDRCEDCADLVENIVLEYA